MGKAKSFKITVRNPHPCLLSFPIFLFVCFDLFWKSQKNLWVYFSSGTTMASSLPVPRKALTVCVLFILLSVPCSHMAEQTRALRDCHQSPGEY